MSVIRAFIAIDLPLSIQTGLDEIIRKLKSPASQAIHWVPAKNIHLTLKFLGDVSPANLELLKKIVAAEAGRQAAFEFTVAGMGAFPSILRPRVVWVGVQAPPALASLQRAIDVETQRLGYAAEERAFSPHLTLGRISHKASPQEVRQAAEVLQSAQVGDLGRCFVDSVKIFRSDLQPGGAVYTQLFSSNLRRV